jgi:hypothetical protein
MPRIRRACSQINSGSSAADKAAQHEPQEDGDAPIIDKYNAMRMIK